MHVDCVLLLRHNLFGKRGHRLPGNSNAGQREIWPKSVFVFVDKAPLQMGAPFKAPSSTLTYARGPRPFRLCCIRLMADAAPTIRETSCFNFFLIPGKTYLICLEPWPFFPRWKFGRQPALCSAEDGDVRLRHEHLHYSADSMNRCCWNSAGRVVILSGRFELPPRYPQAIH